MLRSADMKNVLSPISEARTSEKEAMTPEAKPAGSMARNDAKRPPPLVTAAVPARADAPNARDATPRGARAAPARAKRTRFDGVEETMAVESVSGSAEGW